MIANLPTTEAPQVSESVVLQQESKSGYQVDLSRGTTNTRVSSQWYARPPDERFLSLDELYEHTKSVAQASRADIIDSHKIQVVASDEHTLQLNLPQGEEVKPTHWSFGQMCSLIEAPASYMHRLPAQIAGINLQHGLCDHRAEKLKSYTIQQKNGDTHLELRAMTGPDYGRIYDWEVVESARKILVDDGGHWKVPGVIDWDSKVYNPHAPVTLESTTLFASDRDVFMFLVDDLNPIEIGKLGNGEPDLLFRGCYLWNSEVGSRSLGMATMYLRAVCANRILWGVENFQEVTMRHSRLAPDRFLMQLQPALKSFHDAGTSRVLSGIKSAREAIVAEDDDARQSFLREHKFSIKATKEIIADVTESEGHPPKSIWDFVQGITHHAQKRKHQDVRLNQEREAKKILDKIKVY